MALKNMKDVKRKKEQLEFQSKFYKKELFSSTSGVFGNFTANVRALAFDFAYHMISRLVFSRRKKHHVKVE